MKSHVSDLIELLQHVYIDACNKCTTVKPSNRDIQTIVSRVKHEGLSFLTITLPTFGQDFERSLDEGRVAPDRFRAFFTPKRQAIPAFMQGMLERVFDRVTGEILPEVEPALVEGVRQMAYTFKKLRVPCSPARVSKAFATFRQDELDLSDATDPADITYFRKVSACVWRNAFADYNPFELLPKHGPGATQDRTSGNRKWSHVAWHDRLEQYFPLFDYKFTTVNAYQSEEFKRVTIVDEADEPPVRVITVPKTLKAPRIIAIEPVCMQYTQQAVSKYLVTRLGQFPLTRGHVNFTDQTINQALSLSSSHDGRYATIDLSSASDRVPCHLVEVMLESNKTLLDSILACRTRRAELPDGDILPLKKFASMGSALCFPIESMYFYTICIGALLEKHNLPVTFSAIKSVAKNVYVYGDDIIVPVDMVDVVIAHLQKYYCKVNSHKSFWNGKFRESCGMDAFNGEEVTPTYIRECAPDDKRSVTELISWVQTSNLFHKKGYWRTADFLAQKVSRILGPLPLILETSSALGLHNHFGNRVRVERLSPRYHCPEVRAWVPKPVHRTDVLSGYAALAKSLIRLESRSSIGFSEMSQDHLRVTARYGAVTLKRRWVQPS